MSVDDYVALDRVDDQRWEYVNGVAYRSIDTLTDYLLVDPDARVVEHRRSRRRPVADHVPDRR